MKYILAFGLLFAGPAFAIENLECEYALAVPREVDVVPGYAITLRPGQILIRGHLEGVVSRSDRVHYAVRDEMVARRVFRRDRQGLFILSPGDRIFVLTPDLGRLLAETVYDETMERWAWNSDGEARLVTPNRPVLYPTAPNEGSRIPERMIEDLFRDNARVVVVRSLNAEDFAWFRDRYLPSIQAYVAHQSSPNRFHPINSEERIELAHYEVAHEGLSRVDMPELRMARLRGQTGPELPSMIAHELVLTIQKTDGTKIGLEKNESITLIDHADRVLMTYRMDDERIVLFPPWDERERKLLTILLLAKRAIIVKLK